MIFINCAINPILYNLMSARFRGAFRSLFNGKTAVNQQQRKSIVPTFIPVSQQKIAALWLLFDALSNSFSLGEVKEAWLVPSAFMYAFPERTTTFSTYNRGTSIERKEPRKRSEEVKNDGVYAVV